MEAKPFGNPVLVKEGEDRIREIACIDEALTFLGTWPETRRGPIYQTAVRACRAACEGSMAPEKARSAFAGFARSTGILEKAIVTLEPWKIDPKRGRDIPI
ncbi:DUF982 domain-containing protein [Mesorhizobium sp. CC13]|uniref:DUF982 domain-containing protein n=1 Tax=Mesorhizobium sp. CC13 TaxID=3029194 RepID=UPI00326563F9